MFRRGLEFQSPHLPHWAPLAKGSLLEATDKDIQVEILQINLWIDGVHKQLLLPKPWYKNPILLGGGILAALGIAGMWVPPLGLTATAGSVLLLIADIRSGEIEEARNARIRMRLESAHDRLKRLQLEIVRRKQRNPASKTDNK